jgi:hypothetical protein
LRLTASVRRPEGLVGGPILLDVRLADLAAMRAARDRARASRTAAEQGESAPSGFPPEAQIEPLPLAGDWRREVRFSVAPADAPAPLGEIEAPALLSPTADSHPTSLGVRPALATWAWPPEVTAAWEPGRYQATVELDPSTLGLAVDSGDVLEADVELELRAPSGDADEALLQEALAHYAFARGDCGGAILAGRQALARDRHRLLAHQLVAECEAGRGARAEAAALYGQLLELLPRGADGSDYRIWVENRRRLLQLPSSEHP